MGYKHHPESSGSGAAFAVTLVLALVLVVGAVVVVGGLFFARAVAREQANAVMMQQEALIREAAARAISARAARVAETAARTPRLVTIRIDRDGNIRLDDKPLPFVELKATLDGESSDDDPNTEVRIEVDERCLAATVFDVIQVCNDLGLENVSLAPLSEVKPATGEQPISDL